MSEVSDRYATIAGGFGARVTGVPPDKWSSPSPCTEWTAVDVVAHVVNVHRRVLASLDGSEPDVAGPGDDLPARWSEATASMAEALTDADRASTVVGGMFGDQPFESVVGRLLCTDTLLHTWDLARASGQDDHLDARAVAKALEFLGPIDEAIRRPGGFAPKIEPAEDADEQTRLLNFAGRAT